MNQESTKTFRGVIALIIGIAVPFAIGFLISLADRSPSQSGWLARACLSGGVLVAALIPVGIFCAWLGNALPFSPRINGAIIMAIAFMSLRLAFHLAGLSEEPLLRSLGSGVLLGTIVGIAVGPRLDAASKQSLNKNPNSSA